MMSLELKIAALANKPASEATFREDAVIKFICAFGVVGSAIEKVDAAIMALAEKSQTIDAEIQKRIAKFLRDTSCRASEWQAHQILKIIDGTYVEE